MKKILLLTLLVFGLNTVIVPVYGQFWMMSNKHIYMGGLYTNRDLGINVKDLPGFHWTCGGSFLKLDCTPANPRLSFSNNAVYVHAPVYSGGFQQSSDARLKTAIRTYGDGVSVLAALRVVSPSSDMASKTATSSAGILGRGSKAGTRYDIAAESLREALPDAVKTGIDGNTYVDYAALIPVLVSGIHDLQDGIGQLQTKLDSLTTVASTAALKPCSLNVTYHAERKAYTLSCTLPSGIREACLQVCDASGKEIQVLDVIGDKDFLLSERLLDGKDGYCALVVDGALVEVRPISSH
ncbi:MAG: hypothetical protein ILA34_07880 [Bacteroidaceae bacterium]|nr:hypothetical protein [Bacteroidaceae bacterium]